MKNRRYSTFWSAVKHALKSFFVVLVSVSVAFGQTFGNYLAIGYNEPAAAETSTTYVTTGAAGAKDYANDLASRLAQRLSDEGINGRIQIQSGYGCDTTVCVKVSYTVDGYRFTEEVKISESLVGGNGPTPRIQNPPKPDDPNSSGPSQSAVNALNSAKQNYQNALGNLERASDRLVESRRKLGDANDTLSSVRSDVTSAESRLNSAINDANRAKDAAVNAGQRAQTAAQRASDKRTEFERLSQYKPKLEAERAQLENDLKNLESEVNQAAANTNRFAEGAATTQKDKAKAIADSNRDIQRSAVSSHNTAAASLSNSISFDKDLGDIKPDAPITEASQFRTPANTIGGEKLRKTAFALDTARQTLDTLSPQQREPGTRILPVAQSTLYAADNAYARGDIDQGDFAIRATSALMEMAIGLAPLAVVLLAPEALALLTATVAAALALDLYHSWTGQHLLTGEPLSNFEKSLSMIGVGLAMIPFQSSVKAGIQGIGRALDLSEEFISSVKSSSEAADVVESAKYAEGIIDQANRIGVKTTEGMKNFIDEFNATKVASSTEFDAAGKLARNGNRNVLFQGDKPTCGPTSCGMVLDTYGRSEPLSDVVSQFKIGRDGVTLNDMVTFLNSKGIPTTLRRLDINGLETATSSGNPVIAGVKRFEPVTGKVQGHAIVIDGVTTRQGRRVVAVRDPWGQQYFQTVEEFAKEYLGVALETKGVLP